MSRWLQQKRRLREVIAESCAGDVEDIIAPLQWYFDQVEKGVFLLKTDRKPSRKVLEKQLSWLTGDPIEECLFFSASSLKEEGLRNVGDAFDLFLFGRMRGESVFEKCINDIFDAALENAFAASYPMLRDVFVTTQKDETIIRVLTQNISTLMASYLDSLYYKDLKMTVHCQKWLTLCQRSVPFAEEEDWDGFHMRWYVFLPSQ